MNFITDYPLITIVIISAIFIVACRLIFSIPKIVKNMNAQTSILFLIAKKMEVEATDLNVIAITYNAPSIIDTIKDWEGDGSNQSSKSVSKTLLLIPLIGILLASCTQSGTNTNVTPVTPDSTANNNFPVISTFIGKWKNDTLISLRLNASNNSIPYEDTIITHENGDTSTIVWKGQKYYIWCRSYVLGNSAFGYHNEIPTDSSGAWNNCYIGSVPFDTTTKKSACAVVFSQQWSTTYNNWEPENESIDIYNMTVFDTSYGNIFVE